MANSKKRLLTVLSVLVAMCIMIFTLAACGTDSVVKFMVQDVNGEWKVQAEEVVEDGAVDAPTAPKKEYYTFAGWYLDKEGTNEFKNEEIKENVEVYARYNPVQVNITINNKEEGKMNLIDVVKGEYNPGEGLEFDGWYKDAACSEGNKWNGTETVNALFAKSVAVLKFNNNYEDLYTVKVNPGEIFANPAEQKVTVEGVETTLEKSILKPYMSDENIDYVDVEGNAIDFTKAITKSMTVNVKWSSKISDSSYVLNEETGKYTIKLETGMDFNNAPIISFRSSAIILDENEQSKEIAVEAIDVQTINFIPSTVTKMIFEEGIKSIKGVNGDGACTVEEIILPASAKVVDNSFNNMPKLNKVVIPEGVEVVISSFFKAGTFDDYAKRYFGTVHEFDVVIPASVTNMAMVPNNFKFAEGSVFSKDATNGCIYMKKGDKNVLVSDPQAYAEFDVSGYAVAETIVVPDCDLIQVGTYNTLFNYLILPANFAGVNYNASMADHKYYSAYTNNILYDEASKADPTSTMNPNAYAVTSFVGGFKMDASMAGKADYLWENGAGKVVFTSAKPSDLDKFAFVGDDMGFALLNSAYKPMDNETVAKSIIVKDDSNKAYISIQYLNEKIATDLGVDIASRVNSIVVETSPLTQDDVISKLVAVKYGTELTNALNGNEVKFYANNKEITLGEIKGNMFITAKIIKVPMLIINSAYRISCDDWQEVYDDPTKYVGDYFVLSGWGPQSDTIKIKDITGLSKDMVLSAFAAGMAKAMLPMIGEDYATEAILKENIMWSFNNAKSLKIMMNGEEVTDFSKITLDNGDVTFDIEVEFAPYATQA